VTVVKVGAGPGWTERTRTRKDGQPYKRNVWHYTLMSTYSDAAWTWWQRREETTRGNLGGDEEADYRREHPCPLLKEFMIQLSRDWRDEQRDKAS
jgi:hypothetical protein